MSTPTAEQILKKHLVGQFNSEQEYDDYISRVLPEVIKAMEEQASSVGGMNWVKASEGKPPKDQKECCVRVSVKGNPIIRRGVARLMNGEFATITFAAGYTLSEENNGYDDENIEWLSESPTPILQNQPDDDLTIEAMDFYYRHVCWKLGSSDLGDIERKNYEGLAQKLKIRIQ